MSWSTKILTLYLGFVALILTLVFTCFGHKTELEYKDYYARELSFQEQLDAQANAGNLKEPIGYELDAGKVFLSFPEEILSGLTGNIEFMRPSDASKDILIAARPDAAGNQVVDGLSKGVYKMRINVEQ